MRTIFKINLVVYNKILNVEKFNFFRTINSGKRVLNFHVEECFMAHISKRKRQRYTSVTSIRGRFLVAKRHSKSIHDYFL